MKEVDFVELATYCQNQFKERLTAQEEKYIGTTFVSISDNNEVKFSKTPHVLSKATQAILIHEKSKLALKYWYSWYEVGFVDPEGCVHESRLDGNFRLNVAAWGSNINQIMYLRYGKQTCIGSHGHRNRKNYASYGSYTLKSRTLIMRQK